jgi:hypothetical protein
MTGNRPDVPGRRGTGQATKSVVRQGKTSANRYRRERTIGNPLVAGSPPAPLQSPTSEVYYLG